MPSTQQGSFALERIYPATRARVFKAFADVEAKTKWFAGSDQWALLERQFDFRVGGSERLKGRWPDGTVSTFDATYWDIVPETRIIYCYAMHLDDRKISVSLATLEFEAAGQGTKLTLTEHGVFLDGYDDAGSRERGTGELLDNLGKSLAN